MPGHYELEATVSGFELAWVGGKMRITITEDGGHGPLEALYAQAESVYHTSKKEAERQRGE
jgi:hypothetical protein